MYYGASDNQTPNLPSPHTSASGSFFSNLVNGLHHTSVGYLLGAAHPTIPSAPMSEQQWKDSEYYRDGIKYEPGMTLAQADILASNYDSKLNREVNTEYHPVAAEAGSMVGENLDPANLLPVARSLRPVMEAGDVGRVLAGAAEAGAQVGTGQTLKEGARAAYDVSQNKPIDFGAAAKRIAYATLGGAALGGVGAKIASMRDATKLDMSLRTAQAIEDGHQSPPGPQLEDDAVQFAIKENIHAEVGQDAELSDLARLALDAHERKLSANRILGIGSVSPEDDALLESYKNDKGYSFAKHMEEKYSGYSDAALQDAIRSGDNFQLEDGGTLSEHGQRALEIWRNVIRNRRLLGIGGTSPSDQSYIDSFLSDSSVRPEYWQQQATIARAPNIEWPTSSEPLPHEEQDAESITQGFTEDEMKSYQATVNPLREKSEDMQKAFRLGMNCRAQS